MSILPSIILPALLHTWGEGRKKSVLYRTHTPHTSHLIRGNLESPLDLGMQVSGLRYMETTHTRQRKTLSLTENPAIDPLAFSQQRYPPNHCLAM